MATFSLGCRQQFFPDDLRKLTSGEPQIYFENYLDISDYSMVLASVGGEIYRDTWERLVAEESELADIELVSVPTSSIQMGKTVGLPKAWWDYMGLDEKSFNGGMGLIVGYDDVVCNWVFARDLVKIPHWPESLMGFLKGLDPRTPVVFVWRR